MGLKKGDKVQTKENHAYLDITTRHTGLVEEVEVAGVSVRFKDREGTILFQSDELKKKRRTRVKHI